MLTWLQHYRAERHSVPWLWLIADIYLYIASTLLFGYKENLAPHRKGASQRHIEGRPHYLIFV